MASISCKLRPRNRPGRLWSSQAVSATAFHLYTLLYIKYNDMTVYQRDLKRQFTPTHQPKYKNLLVSGCSYTCNEPDNSICSWPYYLRDLADFENVFDCSQSGSGSNHIFHSVVNEIETDPRITPEDTLVIIMWSGLSRTDFITTKDITAPWHSHINYEFNDVFATLSICNGAKELSLIGKLSQQYKRLVDSDAQVYESLLKIIALNHYLKNKGFHFVFLSWMDPTHELDRVQTPLRSKFTELLDPVPYLDEYAIENQFKENKGAVSYGWHPSPDGYLSWTKNCLIPYLESKQLVVTK
jgi:hypothetical protein